jgi:hypothetical protein
MLKWLMSKIKEEEFWVTNISNCNVSLRDLGITIPSNKCVNLLNSKHYIFNINQLELSAASGSLYKKRDKLLVRQIAPEKPISSGIHVSKLPRFVAQNRIRTKILVEDVKYEELEISEEKFADEMTEE